MINRNLRALSVMLMLAPCNTFPMGNNNQDVLRQVLLGTAAGAVVGCGAVMAGVHTKNHLAQRLVELEAQKAEAHKKIDYYNEGLEKYKKGYHSSECLLSYETSTKYLVGFWSKEEASCDSKIKNVKRLIALCGSPLSPDREATIVKETTRNAALVVAVLYPILRSIGS